MLWLSESCLCLWANKYAALLQINSAFLDSVKSLTKFDELFSEHAVFLFFEVEIEITLSA